MDMELGMQTQNDDPRKESMERVVLVAIGTAALFLSMGALFLASAGN